MAESKRQSMAGKIATPKVGPAKEVTDSDSGLYKAVGARVKVTRAPNNTVLEGTLFTVCNVTNAIALNTATPATPSAPGDYHFIPFSHIVSFEVLAPGERAPDAAPGFEGAYPAISRVDPDAIKQREEHTIKEMKKKDAQKGKGVSKETQDLFDFITRTMPTRWADTSIVVNENVIIAPPYGLNDVKAAKGGEKSKSHVQKIVESFYQRRAPVQQSNNNNRAPVATPIAPRKGG